MNNVHYSSAKDDWETPQKLFEVLDKEFHFTLDSCSTHENAKCEKHYTEVEDGLIQSWEGETVFCNPPYSRTGRQDEWVRKCYEESKKPDTVVVALLPARTDCKRFHEYILGKAEIRFIRGRLNFEVDGKPAVGENGKPQAAPFPSMICIWRNGL